MSEEWEREIGRGLRALAAAERGRETPARVEQALRAAFEAECRRRGLGSRRGGPQPWLAAAASLLVVIAASWIIARGGRPPVPAPPPPEREAGFVAIPYASGEAPLGGGYIVRVRLNRTALVSMGLPAAAAPGGAAVQADLLVGDDGVAHAIRLVR